MNSSHIGRHSMDCSSSPLSGGDSTPRSGEESDRVHALPDTTNRNAVSQKAILIVDDEALICKTYRHAFESVGHRVIIANGGEKVLSVLRDENIWAVFLDIFMRGVDGLETLMNIKRVSPETLVIVMSGGRADFDYLDVASKLGADGVVRKPALPSVLLSLLDKCAPQPVDAKPDRRNYERLRMHLAGHLFSPVDAQTIECRVLNLSAGGALVHCKSECPKDLPLVLYVEYFGRFEGTIAHRNGNLMGLKFSVGEVKRSRLKEMLASYMEHGVSGVTHLRRFPRFRSNGSVTLKREMGQEIVCDVIDISPDGVSLRTNKLIPIGELVSVGKTRGRVVRHHGEGIAMQYVREPSGSIR
jgi:CheY-like chemotaxis protein